MKILIVTTNVKNITEDIETGEGWSDIDNGEIYFIFGPDPEEGTQNWPGKVETVSTINKGITINLFDYQVHSDGKERVDLSNSSDLGLSQGINKDHVLKFVSSKGSDNQNINIWQNGSSGYLNKDMVLPNLSGGYPVLNPDKKGNTGGDESLNYLFNTTETDKVKSVYSNLDYLFQKDANGYYVYDSNAYYAYLSELRDRASFVAYEKENIGFYPFTDPVYDKDTMKAPNNKTGEDSAVLGSRNVNHYFGMTISAGFIQPRGGLIQTADGSSEKMIFEFSGDDDVWVFIDDVLVLDLGGIHAAISGKIDFSTGEVWIKDKGDDSYKPDGTIWEKFMEAGKEDSQEFSGDTFANYTSHTIKFFYLERGNSDSNCMIKFNLPTIPENSVSVAKEVVNEKGMAVDYAEDIDFQFHIEKIVDSKLTDYANQTYTVYQGSSEVGEGKTDEKGYFTLKHDQMAVFEGFSATDQWEVTETGAYLNGYEVEYVGGQIQLEKEEGTQTIIGASTGLLTAGDEHSVRFKNKVKDTTELKIEKQSSDALSNQQFQIKVLFQGEPYKGTYSIGNQPSEEAQNGIIWLKAGETATISGLPYGTSFEVYELLDGFYQPTYAVEGKGLYDVTQPADDNELFAVSGKVTDAGGTVVVTNTKIDIDTGTTTVTVKKSWDENVTDELKPPYIKVTLYKDTNWNGEWDANDEPVLGIDGKLLSAQLKGEDWTHTWSALEPDTDYVVMEEFPAGYEFVQLTSTNEITNVELQGEKNSPNSTTQFNLGKNNLLLVKQTASAGGGYFLWSPIDLKLTSEELEDVKGLILNSGLTGAGSLEKENLTYIHGKDEFQGISLEKTNDGWKLAFDGTSTWSLFWRFVYDRSQNITIENKLDEDYQISIEVQKQWKGDDPNSRPENVTVQLYQNETPYGVEIVLSEDNQWKHTFENLPYYNENGGAYTRNQYTVKETKIGDVSVDEDNGQANGYQSSVSGDAENGFVITNSLASKWEIVKKSASKNPDPARLG